MDRLGNSLRVVTVTENYNKHVIVDEIRIYERKQIILVGINLEGSIIHHSTNMSKTKHIFADSIVVIVYFFERQKRRTSKIQN